MFAFDDPVPEFGSLTFANETASVVPWLLLLRMVCWKSSVNYENVDKFWYIFFKIIAICSPNFVQVGKGRDQKMVFAGLDIKIVENYLCQTL